MTDELEPTDGDHPDEVPIDDGEQDLRDLVIGLRRDVSFLSRGVTALNTKIERRPTRLEVSYRRRLTLLFVVILVLGVMQLTDLHTEVCGPGHRSEAIVRALAHGQIRSISDFNKIAEHSTPGWICGFTFPTHTHDDHSWPEAQHVAGIVLYGLVIAGLGWWAYVPCRRRDEE